MGQQHGLGVQPCSGGGGRCVCTAPEEAEGFPWAGRGIFGGGEVPASLSSRGYPPSRSKWESSPSASHRGGSRCRATTMSPCRGNQGRGGAVVPCPRAALLLPTAAIASAPCSAFHVSTSAAVPAEYPKDPPRLAHFCNPFCRVPPWTAEMALMCQIFPRQEIPQNTVKLICCAREAGVYSLGPEQ